MNNSNVINSFFQILSGQTPQQAFESAIKSNPQAQILLNQMQQSGMSPKDFTLQYAKQNNINLNPILNLLTQRGIKL